MIGGEDDSLDGFTSDVIKMSINTVPLRTLAIDHIARHMNTHHMLSLNNYLGLHEPSFLFLGLAGRPRAIRLKSSACANPIEGVIVKD